MKKPAAQSTKLNIMNYPRLLLILITSLTITACTQPADDPKSVADKYWNLLQTGQAIEAEKLVSISSRRMAPEHSRRITQNTQLTNSEARTVVSTTITTINPNSHYSHTETFNTVLVLQQGQWKIDAAQSQIPVAPSAKEEELQQLTEDLTESMQENIDSIDEAMGEGMQLLNDTLREGSKEMGDSLLHLMNELNTSMEKSINKMKQRREQQLQQQQTPQQPQGPHTEPQTQPDTSQGEGII